MECGVKPVNRDCGSHTIAEPFGASEATKKDYVTPSSSSILLQKDNIFSLSNTTCPPSAPQPSSIGAEQLEDSDSASSSDDDVDVIILEETEVGENNVICCKADSTSPVEMLPGKKPPESRPFIVNADEDMDNKETRVKLKKVFSTTVMDDLSLCTNSTETVQKISFLFSDNSVGRASKHRMEGASNRSRSRSVAVTFLTPERKTLYICHP